MSCSDLVLLRSAVNQVSPELDHGPDSISGHVGRTPLFPLKIPVRGVHLYGKAEWFNPSGSVKDRSVLSILRSAEQSGLLTREKTILDATSGNAGIAYAMIGASRTYKVKLVIPRNANNERKRILKAIGVDLIYTDPLEGSDGAIRKAREIYSEKPDAYFYADQYSNEANWRAHYDTTGVEIWEQTNGSVTYLIAGVGTGGTIMGTGRRLKELNREVEVIAVQPDSPFHGLEGLKHMQTSSVPEIFDQSFPDRTFEIATEEAQAMVKQFAKEGILFGPSSGAAIAASMKLAQEIESGTVVAILPDSGERYLSERFWEVE